MAVRQKLSLFALVAAAILAAEIPQVTIAARVDAVAPTPSDPVSVVEVFHSTLHRGDPATAADLLDDRAIIYEEGDAELTKTEYASRHLIADAAFFSQRRRIAFCGATMTSSEILPGWQLWDA